MDYIDDNPQWNNVGVYAEIGTGRSIKNRAEFKKLLTKCRKHKVDMIITKSISRFSRNTVDALEVCRNLRLLGVEVLFEKENLKLSNPETMMSWKLLVHWHRRKFIVTVKILKWGFAVALMRVYPAI